MKSVKHLNSVIFTIVGAFLFCEMIGNATSDETKSRKEDATTIHQRDPFLQSQNELHNMNTTIYKLKNGRNKDKSTISQDTNPHTQNPTLKDSNDFLLTQLFTKWMSYDNNDEEISISKSLKNNKNSFAKMMHWLSSELKSSSIVDTGRTFFVAPLLAAFPIMAAEVLAIGGMGILGPLLILFPLLLAPLLLVAFIIFI